MKPKEYEIRYAAAEAGIIAWVDVEGDSALADATVRIVEILTSKGILTSESPQASAAVPDAIEPKDAPEMIPDDEEDMQNAYADGWNACRAAMLAASQPEVKS